MAAAEITVRPKGQHKHNFKPNVKLKQQHRQQSSDDGNKSKLVLLTKRKLRLIASLPKKQNASKPLIKPELTTQSNLPPNKRQEQVLSSRTRLQTPLKSFLRPRPIQTFHRSARVRYNVSQANPEKDTKANQTRWSLRLGSILRHRAVANTFNL